MADWRTEQDEEGFPTCNEDRDGDLYTDEFEVTYVCHFREGLGWCWQSVGRSQP